MIPYRVLVVKCHQYLLVITRSKLASRFRLVACESESRFCAWDAGKTKHRSISVPYESSAAGISPSVSWAAVAVACVKHSKMHMQGVMGI